MTAIYQDYLQTNNMADIDLDYILSYCIKPDYLHANQIDGICLDYLQTDRVKIKGSSQYEYNVSPIPIGIPITKIRRSKDRLVKTALSL